MGTCTERNNTIGSIKIPIQKHFVFAFSTYSRSATRKAFLIGSSPPALLVRPTERRRHAPSVPPYGSRAIGCGVRSRRAESQTNRHRRARESPNGSKSPAQRSAEYESRKPLQAEMQSHQD